MPNGIHDKHRERVRDEFLANGFTLDTPPHKILEMLLFYSIPRIDTNELAHTLLNKFGSIEAVLDAKDEDLLAVKGIGKNTVTFFKLIKFTTNFYVNEKHKGIKRFSEYDDICQTIIDKYIGFTKEKIGVTSFGNSGEIVGFDFVAEGDINEVGIPIRKVVETIIKRNASSIIISHNHPNGYAAPSKPDVYFTRELREALELMNIKLIDHIIVSDNDFISLRSSKDYAYVFDKNASKSDSSSKYYEVTK